MPCCRARRALALGSLAALTALAAACSSSTEARVGAVDQEMTERDLAVSATVDLPISEVSGLASLPGGRGWLAVGDREPVVVRFTAEGDRARVVEVRDLSAIFGAHATQWEAVAVDGESRVFFLTETPPRITVLDADMSRIVHEVDLDVTGDRDWRDDGSRGEGLLLMTNGHVLVAKEKDPARLVELGPRGDAARGYRPGMAAGAFTLPSGARSTFVPLHAWKLDTAAQELAPDISELTLDGEGRLLLLSDQGRRIVRVEAELSPGEDTVGARESWTLPKSIGKPEGVAVSGGAFWVADDRATGQGGLALVRASR